MFFIVPDRKGQSQAPVPPPDMACSSPSPYPQKRQRLSPEVEEPAAYYPRRTQKACDRCRIKKARCSGGKICEKCRRDGVICTTNRESRRDSPPPNAEYVHLVESQRDTLLRALYKIYESGASNHPATVAKILKAQGIRVEDLKRAPGRKASHDDTVDQVDLEDVDLRRNADEIQALLKEWNMPLQQSPTGFSPAAEDESKCTLSQISPEYTAGFPSRMAAASTDTTSAPATLLPSPTFENWLALDGLEDSWSVPVVTFDIESETKAGESYPAG